MINVEHLETFGFEPAIRGMRNAMESWSQSDTGWHYPDDGDDLAEFSVGPNDLELMKKLVAAGSDHAKFMRMLVITMDIVAPLYWWKEFDTYKVGTTANSCSTMHKIHAKEFTFKDFSVEHLSNYGMWGKDGFVESDAIFAYAKSMGVVIAALNGARDRYLDYKSRGKDWEKAAKDAWWQMIQLLPSSYNQRRTVMLNYEVAHRQYHARKNHKLDEWHGYCDVLKTLPCSELITM